MPQWASFISSLCRSFTIFTKSSSKVKTKINKQKEKKRKGRQNIVIYCDTYMSVLNRRLNVFLMPFPYASLAIEFLWSANRLQLTLSTAQLIEYHREINCMRVHNYWNSLANLLGIYDDLISNILLFFFIHCINKKRNN